VHRLGRFGGFDVEDPFRQPRGAFERALEQIERGLDDFDRAFWTAA
jgi:protein-tyrosine phosphatase